MKLSLIILFSDGVLDVSDGNGIINENNVPDENNVHDSSKNKAAIAYCDAIAAICNVLSVLSVHAQEELLVAASLVYLLHDEIHSFESSHVGYVVA